MNRKEKEVIIDNVLSTFNKCSAVFVIDFKKINVFKVIAFKKSLFQVKGSVVVVKNSLLSLAAKKNNNLDKIAFSFKEQIALVYAFDDVFKTASVVNDFLKDSDSVYFKSGLIKDLKIESNDFNKISKVKSLSELHSQLCGMLKSSIARLVSVLMQISKK